MMKQPRKFALALLLALSALSGCAYRHYLGLHGPTTRNHPEIHTAEIRDDDQCLRCHGPNGTGEGPVTSHPGFKGCLKCHNDAPGR